MSDQAKETAKVEDVMDAFLMLGQAARRAAADMRALADAIWKLVPVRARRRIERQEKREWRYLARALARANRRAPLLHNGRKPR